MRLYALSETSSRRTSLSPEQPASIYVCKDRGDKLKAAGRFEEALDAYLECSALASQAHDDQTLAIVHGCVGTCHRLLCDYPAAVDHFLRGIHHARIIGDDLACGRTLNNLGLVHWNMGDLDRALELFNEALELHHAGDNNVDAAEAVSNIGRIYAAQHEYEKALACAHRAMSLNAVPDNTEGTAAMCINIGVIFMTRGDLDSARQHFLRASGIARKRGDTWYKAQSLMCMGECKRVAGDYDGAGTLYSQALAMFQQMKDRCMEKGIYEALAAMYESKEDDGRALEYFRKAVQIGAELQNPAVQRSIDHLYAKQEQFAFLLTKEFPGLTPTEIKVCEFLRRNMSTKEISARLNITPQTVDRHRHNIRRKLRLGPDVALPGFLETFVLSAGSRQEGE